MWTRILATLHAWLSDLGPNRDAHNERVRLLANGAHALGLAVLVGGFLGPLFDADRHGTIAGALGALFLWLVFVLTAFWILGYTRGKD